MAAAGFHKGKSAGPNQHGFCKHQVIHYFIRMPLLDYQYPLLR